MKNVLNGFTVNHLLAMFVVFRRIATQDRWCDMERLFCELRPLLAEILCDCVKHFMSARENLHTTVITKSFIEEHAKDYASAVLKRNGCMENCITFNDETVIVIVRYSGDEMLQSFVFKGNKRKNSLKFQAVTTLDGI